MVPWFGSSSDKPWNQKLWNQKTIEHNSPSQNHGTKNKTMEPWFGTSSDKPWNQKTMEPNFPSKIEPWNQNATVVRNQLRQTMEPKNHGTKFSIKNKTMEPKCNRGSEPAQTNRGTKKTWNLISHQKIKPWNQNTTRGTKKPWNLIFHQK